jgi:hypothetical protein
MWFKDGRLAHVQQRLESGREYDTNQRLKNWTCVIPELGPDVRCETWMSDPATRTIQPRGYTELWLRNSVN